jgi:integrase
MSEAIKLGKPQILPSGKVRWRKSYKDEPWISPTYDQDSRRNRQDAWALFVVWREEIRAQLEAKQDKKDNNHPLRKEIVEALQDEISLAQINQDTKQEQWATTALRTVRATDDSNLGEVKELLGLDDSPEQHAAKNVVKSIVSKKRKKEVQTSGLVEEWLKFRLVDVKTGDLSAGGYTNIKRQAERFASFCPNILNANPMKIAEYRADLQLSDMARTSQRDCLSTAKSFLEWCSDTAEVIEPIRALRKRGTGIKVPTKKTVSIWEDEDIHDLFATVTGPMKLHLLLMLNTGAYESDIGTWEKTTLDDKGKKIPTFNRQARTITFKRHKEKHVEEVPTVTYHLWDETYKLLCQHEAEHESLLLTTSTNTSLWSRCLDEKTKKMKAKSTIGKNYRAYRKKMKKTQWGTLDDLRKTSASKLRSHEGRFAKFTQYFAGHSPKGTTDTFYVKPSQEDFDKAVIWLGQQFGFCSS